VEVKLKALLSLCESQPVPTSNIQLFPGFPESIKK